MKKKEKGSARYQNCILYNVIEKKNRAVTGVRILVHQKFENIIDEIKYINMNIICVTIKKLLSAVSCNNLMRILLTIIVIRS